MATIQTDLSEAALVPAIRGNLCEFFRFLSGRLPADRKIENEDFIRWYTSLGHPWFNGLLCLSSPEKAGSSFIKDSIQYFNQQ